LKGKITEPTATESLKTSEDFKNTLLNSSEDCLQDTAGLRSYKGFLYMWLGWLVWSICNCCLWAV